MKISKLFLTALLSFPLFFSCSNDEDVPVAPIPGAYENGFFVINEGSSAKGTVSFISNDLNTVQQDIYGDVNSNDALGGFVQSMFFDGEKAYIISGSSNRITIVDRKTFKVIGKITTGLVNPRYGVVVNGKAYVTNANSYDSPTNATDDFVAVINLSNNTLETSIPLNTTADKIINDSGKLYIIESYNNSNVLVVNTTTKTLETPINIGDSANSMEISNGFLYVLKNPFGVSSELVKIKLSDKTFTTLPFSLENVRNLDIYENKIYYTAGKSAYVMDIAATTTSTTPILTYTSTSTFGEMYGFSVNKNKIFIADSPAFTSNGKVYIYSLTGTLQKPIDVGVGPNSFYFN